MGSVELGAEEGEVAGGESKGAAPPARDIRRYKCDFCSVVRSKKGLIRAHVLEHHKDEVDDMDFYLGLGGGDSRKEMDRDCKVCGASFKKPAHLKQHAQSHSLEISCRLNDVAIGWSQQSMTISLSCYIWMCEALDPKELQNARKP